MRSLYAPLPRCVRIDGVRYALRTDYRCALRALAAFEDETLAPFEQQSVALSLLYPRVPPNGGEALRLAILFLNCGQTPPQPAPEAPRLYSFTHDAPYLYAALRRTHGVDVLEKPMHWYQFAALLSDIAEDTFFARLVYLRRQKALGRLSPEEARAAAALEEYLRLPAPQPSGEAAEFLRLYRQADGKEQE